MQVNGTPLNLSSSTTLTLLPQFSTLSITPPNHRWPPSTLIRMGGGPRTYPGGVSKWQWKRMQAAKSKQLLKARLSRERHIYEMRKRAELKAAVSQLERPWEVVQKLDVSNSSLFSVAADEQLKVLADRFQKAGGYDMWTDEDGPQIFVTPYEGLPTARFFPKGVVHSIRPYGSIGDSSTDECLDFVGQNSEDRSSSVKRKNGHRKRIGSTSGDNGNSRGSIRNDQREDEGASMNLRRGSRELGRGNGNSKMRRDDGNSRGLITSSSNVEFSSSDGVSRMGGDGENERRRKSMDLRGGSRGLGRGNRSSVMRRDASKSSSRGSNVGRGSRGLNSQDIYDMSMQDDGNYGFTGRDQDSGISSRE